MFSKFALTLVIASSMLSAPIFAQGVPSPMGPGSYSSQAYATPPAPGNVDNESNLVLPDPNQKLYVVIGKVYANMTESKDEKGYVVERISEKPLQYRITFADLRSPFVSLSDSPAAKDKPSRILNQDEQSIEIELGQDVEVVSFQALEIVD